MNRVTPTGRRQTSKLLSVQFWGLSAPSRGDTIHGLAWNLARRRVLCCATFHVGRRIYICGFSAPKTKNCWNCQLFRPAGANPLPDVHMVYASNLSIEVVNICCDSVGKLGIYRQKTAMGNFLPKFSECPSSETTGPIQKNQGNCKNGTDIHYLRTKFGGDPTLHGGVRKKS